MKRTMKCAKCNRRMHLVTCHVKNGLWWVCKHHKSSPQSVCSGSVFSKFHIPLTKWLEFMHRFAQGLQLKQLAMITEGIAASSRTLTKMAKVLRKVCIAALKRLRKRGMRIGGRHRFVVIDESKFAHKRKYHRGRCGNTWMLEVDGNSRRPILRLVRDRTRQTLIGQIRRYDRNRKLVPQKRSLIAEGSGSSSGPTVTLYSQSAVFWWDDGAL
ncbi:uncharacterized protein LOC125899213 [Epinephelus fuscoguttatus]|uniref:uncharacterized protein LOC125899213 n=1 Tax=Epinephelus fuscoguttatus TaxID=293821 RepID=UPI0020D05FEA|nr:uncharacterized protein LOC125899213 [Epinephelus fuscoguttatus]